MTGRRPSLTDLHATITATIDNDHAERRRLVFAHKDLAERLTRLPWPYSSPDRWTGHIPPRMVPSGTGYTRNDSPQRVHLVALVAEAYRRDAAFGPDVAKAWLEDINRDNETPNRATSVYDAMHRAADVLDRNTPAWAKDEPHNTPWTPHRVIEGN